jgi:hypothetical protein
MYIDTDSTAGDESIEGHTSQPKSSEPSNNKQTEFESSNNDKEKPKRRQTGKQQQQQQQPRDELFRFWISQRTKEGLLCRYLFVGTELIIENQAIL